MWFRVIVAGLFCVLCAAQLLISEATIEDCTVATSGSPCVDVRFTGPGSYQTQITPQIAPCSSSADDSQTAVLDFRGISVRDTNSLNAVTQDIQITCPAMLMAGQQAAGSFFAAGDVNVNSDPTNVGRCSCLELGNCQLRTIHFNSSSGWNYTTQFAIVAEYGLASVTNALFDVLSAPVIRLNCSGSPDSWEWLNATQAQPNAVLLRDGFNDCPFEPFETYLKWAQVLGYQAFLELQPSRPGYRPLDYGFNSPNIPCFVLHQDDAIEIVAELDTGSSLSASWGPSFLGASVAEAETPAGLLSLDPTDGSVVRNTTAFEFAFPFLSEGFSGGRPEIFWAGSVDGRSRAVKIDATDPAAPVFTTFDSPETAYEMLSISRCPFIDTGFAPYGGTGSFALHCPLVDADSVTFPFALSGSGKERTWTFFTEGASAYAILGYESGWGCAGCYYFGNVTDNANLDLWDVSAEPPVLVDRLRYSQTDFELTGFTFLNGFFYFTDSRNNENVQSYIPVDSTGFGAPINSAQTFTDSGVGSDTVVYERRSFQGLIAVNYGQYGTVFYNVDGSGIASVNSTIDGGFGTGGAVDLASGALTSCGSSTYVRASGPVAPVGALGGLYEYVDVQAYDIFAAPPAPSPSAPAPSPSAPAPSPSAPAPSGAAPSASAPAPGCLSPDSCKYDCTYIEPSKLPKPSVKPSKQPAATKVPEPSYFIIELTYESTAADCGPDCCEVREWLGDDTVAASFYMCSEDSQTKNRAPEYDAKAGTCSIFLAAQEGSDVGEISQAEFDTAVATLEGNFATLCTDAKNCDASTQSGKSASYIIGGGTGSVVASVLLVIAAMAALL